MRNRVLNRECSAGTKRIRDVKMLYTDADTKNVRSQWRSWSAVGFEERQQLRRRRFTICGNLHTQRLSPLLQYEEAKLCSSVHDGAADMRNEG